MTYTRVSGSAVLTSSAACSASRSTSATRTSSTVKIKIRPYGLAGGAAPPGASDPLPVAYGREAGSGPAVNPVSGPPDAAIPRPEGPRPGDTDGPDRQSV